MRDDNGIIIEGYTSPTASIKLTNSFILLPFNNNLDSILNMPINFNIYLKRNVINDVQITLDSHGIDQDIYITAKFELHDEEIESLYMPDGEMVIHSTNKLHLLPYLDGHTIIAAQWVQPENSDEKGIEISLYTFNN